MAWDPLYDKVKHHLETIYADVSLDVSYDTLTEQLLAAIGIASS